MAIYLGAKKVQTFIGEVSDLDSNSLVDATITKFESKTLKSVASYGFGYKGLLRKIDLWSVESIAKSAFFYCYKLDTLIIRTPKVCDVPDLSTTATYQSYVFWKTPIEKGAGYIYVPDDLVAKYKTHTNWCYYRSQIKPISELRE